MSAIIVTNRKRTSYKNTSKPLTESASRKRRRNRTTQSCTNCHISKRMCDRKRPACARCTQLGLTGLCVYEVDDPNQQPEHSESLKLLKRVAELESVIRELKNKPLPRWLSEKHSYDPYSNSVRLSSSSCSTLSSQIPFPPSSQASGVDEVHSPNFQSTLSTSPLISPSITIPTSSCAPESTFPELTVKDLSSIFARGPPFLGLGRDDAEMRQVSATNFQPYDTLQLCSCMLDAHTYQTMLELSLRLRNAAEMLSQYPGHQVDGNCILNQRLMELDTSIADNLASVHLNTPCFHSTPDVLPALPPPALQASENPTTLLDSWFSTMTPALNISGTANDSLMSWEPGRWL